MSGELNIILTLILATISSVATAVSTYAALISAGVISKPGKKEKTDDSTDDSIKKEKQQRVKQPKVRPPKVKQPKVKQPRRKLSRKKEKLILIVWTAMAIIAGIIAIVSFYKVYMDVVPEPPPSDVAVMIAQGETSNIPFGGYTWRVLDVQDDKALLITEDSIEQHRYHDKGGNVTWETCTLREYLNGAFYESFSEVDRKEIALTRNENPDNTWGRTNGRPFNTPGGNPTEDYIFLLSVADVLQYFPNLELHKDRAGNERDYRADERLVAKLNNSEHWWWLRSPGMFSNYATTVDFDGRLFLRGLIVNNYEGGVRPALWVKL